MDMTQAGRSMLAYRRPSFLRLFALVFTLVAGLAIALGAMLSAAQAAPVGKLTQFKVPTAGSSPEHITQASDGTFWFTGSFLNDQNTLPHKVGRITPDGKITEFDVCEHPDFGFEFCFPTDIVQGSDGVLYFTKNDAPLGRITTDGEVLPDAGERFSFNGTEIAVKGFPRQINIAGDRAVWFTERFDPQAVGRINPATNDVQMFPIDGGPEDIAPAGSGGEMWFTRTIGDNIARISPTGEITAMSRVMKGSEPVGITVDSDGNPWFTMLSADRIATLQLR